MPVDKAVYRKHQKGLTSLESVGLKEIAQTKRKKKKLQKQAKKAP